jgi:dynein heavy chain
MNRCRDNLDIAQTVVQFSQLAEVEIGGTQGKTLSTAATAIWEDFQNGVMKFTMISYDMMDVGADGFSSDYYNFRQTVKELERRLSSLLGKAFDDGSCTKARFNLLDAFHALLERPNIESDIEKRLLGLVKSYGQDLSIVQDFFFDNRDDPNVSNNLPRTSGAIAWCKGLIERISQPMTKLQGLSNRAILDNDESTEIVKLYRSLRSSLEDYVLQNVSEWGRDVENVCNTKLKMKLIKRERESKFLTVNFDKQLKKLLREVNYFLKMGLIVPESAEIIFHKTEYYRSLNHGMDRIVTTYNHMIKTMLPVEVPLLKDYIDAIDNAIKKGIDTLDWNNDGLEVFVTTGKEVFTAANEMMTTLKTNLAGVDTLLIDMAEHPLLARQSKAISPKDLMDMNKVLIKEQYHIIKDSGTQIHNLLKESMKALKISQHSADWLSYLDFANNVVSEGLASNAVKSLDFLLTQLQGKEVTSMLQIELKLMNPSHDVAYDPSIFAEDDGLKIDPVTGKKKPIRLRSMLDTWITSILNGGNAFRRLDSNSGDYRREIVNNAVVRERLMQINAAIDACEQRCSDLREKYTSYEYLWNQHIEDVFEEFKVEATLAAVAGKSKEHPDLKKFDAEIIKYRNLQKEINALEQSQTVNWLEVDLSPMNQALKSWVGQWIMIYLNYLKQDSVSQLNALQLFMKTANVGLDSEVEDGNMDSLMTAMGHIRDVRVIKEQTENMFKPLHGVVGLLKKHSVNIEDVMVGGGTVGGSGGNSEEILPSIPIMEFLEAAPQKWRSTHRRMLDKKETIMAQVNDQSDQVKVQLDEFFLEVREFRNVFRKEAPFSLEGAPDVAYGILDRFNKDLSVLVTRIEEFGELEELFEIPPKSYPEATDTKSEMQQLKKLWDFHSYCDSNYAEWGELLWNDIDTEKLAGENKVIMKALRKFTNENPVVKAWASYTSLESKVKEMDGTLPLVEELHSRAMGDRHWESLAKVCAKEGETPEVIDVTNPTFSLNNLIEIGVQQHIDDCEEIIEIANKELKVDRKLKDISAVWKDLILLYTPYKDTEIKLVKVTDDIIEALEDNQLELQTMIGMGKFVDHFRSEVEMWQKRLGDVESVLKEWTAVTKQWCALETIFLGSADIRAQLPEDTKRFEGIDGEFKDLMKTTEMVSNVIEACCQEGREEALKGMAANLELCQRALNEYLDMKKKIFPRFYFVSNIALLDMLSNGNNPPRIMKHLGSCYDALCDLQFVEGSTNVADAMVAKDGEIVPFNEPFTITGAVEDWLNLLTVHMQNSLRYILNHAYNSAAEWETGQPRHEWLYNYPAQAVLSVGPCVSWSEETEASLEDYLGGNEDAVKSYLEMCNTRLANLITLVRGKLASMDRRKIIATITLDVHGRDVVKALIAEKTEGPEAFAWSRQLRFYWVKEDRDIQIRICDYRTMYSYEYIGNTGRLVITPLTDRCYITLGTALRLMLSGAPAGPAGTGKTETVKDMGRAIALCVYVFNCSPQMNYRGLADIFKGLAQSGSWGCFDEFNRISIDVLSVVATQVKTVQDAIVLYSVPSNREEKYQTAPPGQPPVCVGSFTMLDDELTLIPTCGIFITMNPGYAGRTELPENLKTLFRTCAMIRPDLAPICENMLMSEGYQGALLLSVKFTTLYGLCKALLSPQHHYDWGLRAVKSVLVVAGKLLRANPELDEECVLMRALRDFNTPKIPAHDMPIFMRLIKDLFPAFADTTPPVINETLKQTAAKVCIKKGLQPNEELLIKVVQFQELLDVRHSVMLLGPAGCGKTTIWETLLGCHNHGQEKRVAVAEVVNPKAVFNEELFGYMTLAKDWKDGCLSIVMRGMSFNDRDMGYYDWQTTKWVVLDDDVDTLWIESMNTVMDANKMLTLVSNERIPLTDAMRMVFEIDSIDNGSPATVSRAGMLYINETDIGWRPYVDSWIERLPDITEEGMKRLSRLVDKYMLSMMQNTRKGLKKIIPIRVLSQAMSVCSLMQGVLTTSSVESMSEEALESNFCYCLVWAFGGCLNTTETKTMFDNMFSSTFTDIKYPKEGEVFDYYYDTANEEWTLWSDRVVAYEPDGVIGEEVQFFDIVVNTLDSTRISTIMGSLVTQHTPVMFVGGAGTGKTTLMNTYFANCGEKTIKSLISMNYFTDSASFQQQLEGPIDKRSGKIFGPPTGKTLVYFVDDINLPYIEDYGTQNSLSLCRQSLDYCSYFDRENLGLKKEVVDTQYVAAMNPTAGSFTITERLQRHFSTFSVAMPTEADQRAIYGSILTGHLESFDHSVSQLHEPIMNMTLDLHSRMIVKFLPSAIKFVYNWNLRELDNVFNGLTRMTPDYYSSEVDCLRLFVHEINRTFSDRLNDESDLSKFNAMMIDCYDKAFKDVKGIKKEDVFAEPLIFTDFHKQPGGVATYLGVPDSNTIQTVLDAKLEEYNESNTIMELVLFKDAIAHVCRIARIIAQPRGNALLIGVGGSGKQSLSRLATFICGYEVRQLSVSSRYGVEDFKEELRQMYITAGQKGIGLVFLLTDSHIVNEKFLIYVNDLLSNGFIPDLFPQEDLDGLVSSVRNLAKQAGVVDSPAALLKFFIDRVRSLLHVVLCFSPVGDVFRVRARRFPGLVNCKNNMVVGECW